MPWPGDACTMRGQKRAHMADATAMMTGMGTGTAGMSYQMDDKAMEFLSLQENVSDIMGEVVESVEKIAEQMPKDQF